MKNISYICNMKASELRIENYIKMFEEDGFIDIKLNLNDICNVECAIDNRFKPIPLTEEWLIKFGFEKLNVDIIRYEKSNLIVEWLFERWTGRLYDDFETSIQITEIKYVHQLQNLYFALTQKELEL